MRHSLGDGGSDDATGLYASLRLRSDRRVARSARCPACAFLQPCVGHKVNWRGRLRGDFTAASRSDAAVKSHRSRPTHNHHLSPLADVTDSERRGPASLRPGFAGPSLRRPLQFTSWTGAGIRDFHTTGARTRIASRQLLARHRPRSPTPTRWSRPKQAHATPFVAHSASGPKYLHTINRQ